MAPICLFSILLVQIISFGGIGDASLRGGPFQEYCERVGQRYRQIDGTCNHRLGYGVSGQPVKRYIPAQYQDGEDSPRAYSIRGKRYPLPSPRLISMNLHPDKGGTSKFTLVVMQFGQFIDHDLTMAPRPSDMGPKTKCCVPKSQRSHQCFPITIPSNDPTFTIDCMEFLRSDAAVDAQGRKILPREQTNALTSFLDASSIYGDNIQMMRKLRTQRGRGALLKTQTVRGKIRLPKDDGDKNCLRTSHPLSYCQMSGDARVNEQPGLSSMHLVFHVYHNDLVRSLAKGILRKRSRTDREPTSQEVENFVTRTSVPMKEILFQEARKIMGGILQKITYCDWLPLVLGPKLYRKYRLDCRSESTYDPQVDPRIANAFLTAAFRFGHSLVPNRILVAHKLQGLGKMFNVPDPTILHHESIIQGLCEGNMSRPMDRFVSRAVTTSLFQTSQKSLDLIALNIQRGRDHGIPSFYYWRKHFGLRRFEGPEEFGSKGLATKMRKLFRHPRDVDLFTAGLLEKPVRGGMVGETFGNILGQQFSDMKHGDAHFFLSTERPQGFTKAQRKALLQVSIARLMCYNSGMGLIQLDPFMESKMNNPLVPCKNLPDLDLTPWIDSDVFF